MGLFSKTICGVCGGTIRGQYLKINDQGGKGKLLYNICLDCNQKFRMITQDKLPYPIDPQETKQIIESGLNPAGVVEKRMLCNVCGEVFCYSDKDLSRNRELLNEAYKARKMAVMEALGGTRLASNQNTDRADNIESQIVDYSKCPKCNSTDIVEISADEFKLLKEKQNNAGNVTTSAADEIKKFKELLDMGIITQEEFDAKKKQLLGL